MCTEQIMAWLNANGTGISAVLAVMTIIAIGVQAFFAGKLFGISKKQAMILTKQTLILDEQAKISDLMADLQYIEYWKEEVERLHDSIELFKRKVEEATEPKEKIACKLLIDSYFNGYIESQRFLGALLYKAKRHKDRILSELSETEKKELEEQFEFLSEMERKTFK